MDRVIKAKLVADGLLDVYLTYTGEERGLGSLIAVSSTRANAEAAGEGKGWYGGPCTIMDGKAIRFQGKIYLLSSNEPVDLDFEQQKINEQIRRQALGKLNDVEKRALGF